MGVVNYVVDIIGSQFFIKNVLYDWLGSWVLGSANMENVKIVLVSIAVTLVVLFGFVSINSSGASAVARDVPFSLDLTIIIPQDGGEPVVTSYSSYDIVEGENGVYVAQVDVAAVDEEEGVDVNNEEVVDEEEGEIESVIVDYSTYNVDYIDEDVRGILVDMLGGSDRFVFYLPPTDYVNVSRGMGYGVAYGIQNVDADVSEENEFVFSFDVDSASAGDCGVSEEEAQGWIVRGWGSSGVIGGQWREDSGEWFDIMTIYFAFPDNMEACSVKYDFVITKDGVDYGSKTLVFNLV